MPGKHSYHHIIIANDIAVLWIWIGIRMFLGLLDKDPLVRVTDLDLDPVPDPFIIKQK